MTIRLNAKKVNKLGAKKLCVSSGLYCRTQKLA